MDLKGAPRLTELRRPIERLFESAARKTAALAAAWDPAQGSPVFTVKGRYTTRGWTEWTRGFQYGTMLLAFDATGDRSLADRAAALIDEQMPHHVTHMGVHDHGFNIVSTYGTLRRLTREGRLSGDEGRMKYYEMAIRCSGAIQAARWTSILDSTGRREGGFIHSFNGPHSLFADTMRSLRSLSLAHQLGHELLVENDRAVNLLDRAIRHAQTTAAWNIFHGEVRDIYDTPQEAGRVAHESLFNVTDGRYRCPSTQQGYSPFSTWTRGLAWVLLGFAEQLEFLAALPDDAMETWPEAKSKGEVEAGFLRAAMVTAEWYLRHSFVDGMVYWDGGAPGIRADNDYGATADPFNDREPIDSSAAAIAGQGFVRLSDYLRSKQETGPADRYDSAARRIAATLFDEPYFAADPDHQGLILHSVYHRPRGWDHVPAGRRVPCGESSMWGDYHTLELALLLHRRMEGMGGIVFFDR